MNILLNILLKLNLNLRISKYWFLIVKKKNKERNNMELNVLGKLNEYEY